MNARYAEKHDSLRLTVTEQSKRKVSLAVNRRGFSCSGSADVDVLRVALSRFAAYMKAGKESNGDKMRRLQGLADQSTTLEAFIDGITTL